MDVRVGDIVKTKNKEGKTLLPAAVTKTYDDGESVTCVEVLFSDGTYGYRGKGKWKVTGRSVDIQGILEAIQ